MEHFHFIGIGGVGMSALARILLKKGAIVSGTDANHNYLVEKLLRDGAHIYSGDEFKDYDSSIVVYSSAIKKDHPEYIKAIEAGSKLLHRSEVLALLMRGFKGLLIAGSHGKTTTSSLLAYTLHIAGLNPSYAVGGTIKNLKTNSDLGTGDYFVAETDESDGSFLGLEGFAGIITNIDDDHLDFWETKDNLMEGFQKFFEKIFSKEHIFWCADDETLSNLRPSGFSYGFKHIADLRITNCVYGYKTLFSICFQGETYEDIELSLSGEHNVLNASAVFGLAIKLGVDQKFIREAFKTFEGATRRLELVGSNKGVQFFDDYAHHPNEILATLKALRSKAGERRILAIFQPHRYTRANQFLHVWPDSLSIADKVIVTDIYAASESPIEGVDAKKIQRLIAEKRGEEFSLYIAKNELIPKLKEIIHTNDIVITLGAGDITYVAKKLVENI